MEYTVGELAKRSGLTVRALHHYEKLGLLLPSGRTQAGYRLYGEANVQTLHRILAYQQMGLALNEIAPLLGRDAPPLLDLLKRQIMAAEAELTKQQNLLSMLRRVAERASAGGEELTDHLLTLMAMRRSYERHFTQDDLQKLQAVQTELGEVGVAHLKAEMAELIPALKAAMAEDADPRSPAVAALARRWIAMGRGIPDDADWRRKGREMFAAQPQLLAGSGLTLQLLDFIDEAVSAEKARV